MGLPTTSLAHSLLLIEPPTSPFYEAIERSARAVDFDVERRDAPVSPGTNAIIGVGPSVQNPLQVARDVRRLGGEGLVVLFAATTSARDALRAEMLRDPFLWDRCELIELTDDQFALSARLAEVGDHSRAAAHELSDSSRQQDEFLAIMSHELRTPLTTILGYTDMLLRGVGGDLPPRTSTYLGNMRAAGDRLLELINGLVDYTRLEAGAEQLELAAVDLPELVARAVERCAAPARAKQIELQVSAAAVVDSLRADADKVERVLRSYLSNALKFTPAGGEVHVDVAPDASVPEQVRVSVSDTGIGLRREQLPRVWERFYQGDASLTRTNGGMGLGLSVARHLVLLHGGAVGASSAGPGRGSTFWFSLPRYG